jgi:hypothetical protein
MERLEKQQFIRRIAPENQTDATGSRVYWSRHAILEMVKDNLTRPEIEQTLLQGEIIEDYPAKYRLLPDCLVLAFLSDRRPLHAVIAIDVNQEPRPDFCDYRLFTFFRKVAQ